MSSDPSRQQAAARPDQRGPTDREVLAETVAARLDKPLTALGVIFVLVVVADTTADPGSDLRPWLEIVSWGLWAVFAVEFLLRAVIARSTPQFLRRNWWQILFLVLPFLRFLRISARLARLRPARLGRLLSSSVRGVRTAGRALTSRVAWLAATTTIVVLASSQILYGFAGYDSYAAALHDAMHAAVTGGAIEHESGVADVLELVLAVYAVGIFAVLAGSVGAYLLESRPVPPGVEADADGPAD